MGIYLILIGRREDRIRGEGGEEGGWMVWGDSLLATEADVDSDMCQKSAQLKPSC